MPVWPPDNLIQIRNRWVIYIDNGAIPTHLWCRRMKNLLLFAIHLALFSSSSMAQTGEANSTSLGKPTFDARWRNEWVDDDAFFNTALAQTLRLRLGYQTALYKGWSGAIELEHTQHVFGERFNSSANNQGAYPLIVDPDNTELNQLYLNYAPSTNTALRIGRQRIVYANQRFFGNVGWRQNEQTFDGIDAQHRFISGLTLRYSYLDRVQRVFGNDHPNRNLARWKLNTNLVELGYPIASGTLSGYAHFIDNETLPLTSHQNIGLRFGAKHEAAEKIGWILNIEYARQNQYADGLDLIDAHYELLEGGIIWRANTFKVGWENLSGDGQYGFATPFATLHAFNGWADRFLTTPVNGLQDTYLGWNRKWGNWGASVVWHDFQSDRLDLHYGQEWNASLNWVFKPHWNALFKVADFQADDVGFDVQKTWLSVEYIY
jgi:Alginate export